MAQQVEHVLGKDEVAGSSPANSSKENHLLRWFFLYFTPYLVCFYEFSFLDFGVPPNIKMCHYVPKGIFKCFLPY